jgi:hypothetical protein
MRSANSSLEFLCRISRRRLSVQDGVESISEYVEWRAAQLTSGHLAELRTDLPLLKVRFAAIAVPQFPHLRHQLELLADFFEDTAGGVSMVGRMQHERKLRLPFVILPQKQTSSQISFLRSATPMIRSSHAQFCGDMRKFSATTAIIEEFVGRRSPSPHREPATLGRTLRAGSRAPACLPRLKPAFGSILTPVQAARSRQRQYAASISLHYFRGTIGVRRPVQRSPTSLRPRL